MPNPTGVGFFGKLPGVGDFVQRRLPARFVEVWDQHFERGVEASRGALGEAWHEAYRASPVWHFLLAPHACTEAAWAGVMGPAVDRVGRCFPMVLAAPLAADPALAAQLLDRGDGWFAELERVHRDAQANAGMDAETFAAQVAALPAPLDGAASGPATTWDDVAWRSASHWRLPLPRLDMGALRALWLRLASDAGAWCLWWTEGGGRVPAGILLTNGLPQASAYAGFLDAAHAGAPWQSAGTVARDVAPGAAMPAARSRRAAGTAERSLPDTGDATATVPVARRAAAVLAAHAPARLPDDLSELFADLAIAATPAPASTPATDATATSRPSDRSPVAADAVLYLHDCELTLVAANAGAADARQRAAAEVRAVAEDLDTVALSTGTRILREHLMRLHASLQRRGDSLIDPVREDGAVVAVQISGQRAALLRIGAAGAWHWRHGQLRPLFAAVDAAPLPPDAGQGGDFDDLLFSRPASAATGLGAAAQPVCDEVVCTVAAGDRLLLLATHGLLQVSTQELAAALALPSCGAARTRIAAVAGVDSASGQWPLAVIEVTA